MLFFSLIAINGIVADKIAAYKRAIEKAKNTANDSSNYFAEKGLLYSINNHYPQGQADMLMALAITDKDQGRYEQAKIRALIVIDLYRHMHNLKSIAALENFVGSIEAAR